jgi:glycosyltransferase involved in cell wall biosynthesis
MADDEAHGAVSAGLTIGIDARAAAEVPAGRGRVVRELLRALAERNDPHRYICYARERWQQSPDDRFEWQLIDAGDPLWHAQVARRARRQCDVFLATNSYLTVILNRLPTVAIVYDLVTFDRSMAPNRRSMVIERLTLGGAVARARWLVCISQATEEALLVQVPAARGKTSVAHLGAVTSLSAPTREELTDLPDPGFVLAVGTLEPRKNLPRLVAAFAALPLELQAAHPLVVVGAMGWQTGPTLAALRSLGNRCMTLGYVSDEALTELYRRCGVFCFPSLGEGFGLPVLEAMAVGSAVITSNVSSLPEVGGEAVEYVDPRSIESIAGGLERVLASPARQSELRALAAERAKLFSWESTTELVLTALEHAATS